MTEKIPITVLVQTRNEEVGIADCLGALGAFDEVMVVDSKSEDRTAEICDALGVQVVDFVWNGAYPKKKQWQLENVDTRNDWLLFLDADERPSGALLEELRELSRSVLREPEIAAVELDLDYVFSGKVLRHGHRVTKRALVRRDLVSFPPLDDLHIPGMGELEGHYQPEARGRVIRAKGRILHHDLDPVSSWFHRHNKYSDWEAHLRHDAALQSDIRRRRTLKGRIFDAVPFKPLLFFVYCYFFRAGFMDGRAGFDYAFALSTYYWQIGLKVRELGRDPGVQE